MKVKMILLIGLLLGRFTLQAADPLYNEMNRLFARYFEYPSMDDKVEGRVYVVYSIYHSGLISRYKLAKGIHPAIDKAVMDALRTMSRENKFSRQYRGTDYLQCFYVRSNVDSMAYYAALQAKDTVYTYLEDAPEFPGGEEAWISYLKGILTYPQNAMREGSSGRVEVSFVLDKDGYVKGAYVPDYVSMSLDQEALRVVANMPQWKPGRDKKGKPVQVRCQAPIWFLLK